MRSSNLFLGVLVMGVSVLVISASASATIVNMTTGQTLFYDNFEGMGTNVSHAAYPDASGDYNPTGGSPGLWNIIEDAPQVVQVTDATGANGPGTLQGSNYLRLHKYQTDFSAGQLFTVQSTTGHHIHWEQMLYAGSLTAGDNPVQILGDGTDGRRFNILTSYGGYGVVGSYNGADFPPAALTVGYVANKWQKWEIDYNIGDAFLKLTIDGVSASNVPIMSGGNLGAISLDSGSVGYADEVAVPEPSTVTMLMAGLLSLLAYAWKKMK